MSRWRPVSVSSMVLGLSVMSGACVGSTDVGSTDTSSEVSTDRPSVEPTSDVPAARPGRNAPIVGVAVPGGSARGVSAIEQSLDVRIDLVRLFFRWDDPFPDADVERLLEEGRLLHVSIRPRTTDGTVVRWADLAQSEPGSAAYGQLVAWADRLAQLPAGSYVTINHEPETSDSQANGTSEEFVAMWRRFADVIAERGGDDLQLVWTMTGGAFRDGRAELWYPGDDVVDVVGADLYNWFTCQGTNRDWLELERLLVEPTAFARARDKPLAIPEVASVEDPSRPGRKAEWIDNASAALADDGVGGDVEFVAWFDVTAPGGTFPNCVWDHDTSPDSAEAFGRLLETFSAGG